MQGRKPKPTELKRLAGNPGKRPLNDSEPRFGGEWSMRAPRHLSDDAKAEWKRVAPLLASAGVLTAVDRAALAGYCQAWARWIEAEKMIEEQGYVLATPSGYQQQSPYVTIANKALELVKTFAVEFGMTPSSRSRIKTEPVEKEKTLAEVLFEHAQVD
jgi:P27 family predicted phage terminase small subunit